VSVIIYNYAKEIRSKSFFSKDKRGLTVNRFKSKDEVFDLINKLYNAGAKIVFITGIYQYISDNEMYADKFIIELPEDSKKRAALFTLCNQEIINEGFDPLKDNDQKEIELWWD